MTEQFPCKQCGAVMRYAIGTDTLSCAYCDHIEPIPQTPDPIEERDYRDTLNRLAEISPREEHLTTQCTHCGAEFTLNESQHADDCPFCGSAVVLEAGSSRRIQPWAVLPFAVDRDHAMAAFRRWVNRLWFAPAKLKNLKYLEQHLIGMYLPYWSFDSHTATSYDGMRGTVYYTTEYRSVRVNGQMQRRATRVARIRWRRKSGRVRRAFDDVLAVASRTLPQRILVRLRHWDLGYLRHYRSEYLAGFQSEYYQVALDAGFNDARGKMDAVIRQDIRHDIGGDRQRILRHHTQHDGIHFKHLLLPVWIASFRHKKRSYRFVVNGRTGEVHGDRPFSRVKIAVAVGAGVAAAGSGAWYVVQDPASLSLLIDSGSQWVRPSGW